VIVVSQQHQQQQQQQWVASTRLARSIVMLMGPVPSHAAKHKPRRMYMRHVDVPARQQSVLLKLCLSALSALLVCACLLAGWLMGCIAEACVPVARQQCIDLACMPVVCVAAAYSCQLQPVQPCCSVLHSAELYDAVAP
jgi:hypothetical protein